MGGLQLIDTGGHVDVNVCPDLAESCHLDVTTDTTVCVTLRAPRTCY